MLTLEGKATVEMGQLEFGLGAQLPSQAERPFIIPSSSAIANLASFAVVVASASSTGLGPWQAADIGQRIQVVITSRARHNCTSAVAAEKDPGCSRLRCFEH